MSVDISGWFNRPPDAEEQAGYRRLRGNTMRLASDAITDAKALAAQHFPEQATDRVIIAACINALVRVRFGRDE